MKRYYACVNDCGYKTGPYYDNYDEQVANPDDPYNHWRCYNCPDETITDDQGNSVTRVVRLKPAHVYNKKEQAAMRRAEFLALGLPPGGPRLKVQKPEKFGAGILDID